MVFFAGVAMLFLHVDEPPEAGLNGMLADHLSIKMACTKPPITPKTAATANTNGQFRTCRRSAIDCRIGIKNTNTANAIDSAWGQSRLPPTADTPMETNTANTAAAAI